MQQILLIEEDLKTLGRYISYILRFQFRLLSGLVLALFTGLLLLLNPSVQDFAGEQVAQFLSVQWRTKVELTGFKYKLLRSFSMEQLYIEDHNGDTLLLINDLELQLGNIRILRQQIDINHLRLGSVDARLLRKEYEEDFNFKFLVDYFWSDAVDSLEQPVSPIRFRLGALSLGKSQLRFENGNRQQSADRFDPRHFTLTDLQLVLSDIYASSDSSSVRLSELQFVEKTGFSVKKANFLLVSLPDQLRLDELDLRTFQSNLAGALAMNFGSYEDFNDFNNRVRMQLQLERLALTPGDMRYFLGDAAPLLPVRASGTVSGRLANLRSRDLQVELGNSSYLNGQINITGLPAYENALYDIRLRTAYLDKNEVGAAFPVIQFPEQIKGLQFLQISGEVFGYPEDFVAKGSFSTNLGSAQSDLNIKLKGPQSSYSGQLALTRVDLRSLTGDTTLGLVTLNTSIKGQGDRWENFEAQLKGDIQQIDYRNYRYQNTSIDGYLDRQTFTGRLSSLDSNANFSFYGLADLGATPPFFNFVAEVNALHLHNLHLTSDSFSIQGFMEICAEGLDIDSIVGELNFRHLALQLNGRPLDIEEMNVISAIDQDQQRRLNFQSPIGNAYLTGDFSVKGLPATLDHYLHHYVQRSVQRPYPEGDQNFELNLDIQQAQVLADFIAPGRFDIGGMRGHAYFNTVNNSADLDFQLGNFRAGSTRISNINAFGNSNDDSLFLDLYADSLWSGQVLLAQQLVFENSLSRDTLLFGLRAMGEGPSNELQLDGYVDFATDTIGLVFLPSYVQVFDNRWTLEQAGAIRVIDSTVRVPAFGFRQGGQSVLLAGNISPRRTDTLSLLMTDVDLEQLNPLLAVAELSVEGYANVRLEANSVLRKAAVFGGIDIEGFVLDGQPLGDLTVRSEYSVTRQVADVHAELVNEGDTLIYIFGTLGNLEGDQSMDLQAQLRHSPIHPLEHLLKPIFDDVSGRATADLSLKGDFWAPELRGQVDLENARLRVDFLNQYFNVNKRVTFEPTSINFQQAEITDDGTGTGRLSGRITHEKFRKTKLDLHLTAKELMVLNTEPNFKDAYFGTGRLTGTASFVGPVSLVDIQVRGSTDKGTSFSIPLDAEANRQDVDFITFINKNSTEEVEVEAPVFNPIGINFGMALQVTPEAEISILLDRVAGDIIRGRGAAAIEFRVNPQGEIRMVGDYRFSSGDYTFTLANIPSKRFRISDGSTIQWTGDPYDANINLVAVYRQRASVAALLTNEQLSSRPRTQLNVDTYLKLTGSLLKPTVSFEIKLPTINENEGSDPLVARIQNINNNEQELNNQVLALLIAGQFFPSDQIAATNFLGSTGANSLTEVLSNQLNALLSQMFDNVNIGINYRSSNLGNLADASRNDISVALNTTLFNNRVVIDGNVGNNVNNLNTPNAGAQAIAGEVVVEYLMTPDGSIRLKAFNKLDDRVLVNRESSYRQGVGISYTENYNTFDELLVKPTRFIQDRLIRRIPWAPDRWKGDF
ncbi:MAG: translocation/assembly module TamB domain-containing protein [Sphingobacteriaceae bacterium]|nr:translocation/assembly module TamB domain-containing protein [Sphingobacteriaceae bacterium]